MDFDTVTGAPSFVAGSNDIRLAAASARSSNSLHPDGLIRATEVIFPDLSNVARTSARPSLCEQYPGAACGFFLILTGRLLSSTGETLVF